MRLGLLGPALGEIGALGRAAEFLLNVARVHRAIYLGNDGALDRAVDGWARKLVGEDPSDDGAWRRAAELAQTGTPAQLDRFVTNERARLRLLALEALPAGGTRTFEMVGDRVALLLHDRGELEEEELAAANLVVFGKSDTPAVRRAGTRWLVTPGPLGSEGGIAVLDDEEEDITVTLFDGAGQARQREVLHATRSRRAEAR